jgi:histidinol-phosphatase (PHP family)
MYPEPILYESHMHTPLCHHASGYPEAYAAVAQKRGLKGIIVTCHNPTHDGWSPSTRMRLDEFEDYVTMVEQARQTWAGRVDVRLGLESDYVPGVESWLEELHGRAEFHHILGSVHPTLPDYQNRYLNGDIVAFQRTYFEHLAMAAETGLFDTLSHPDLVKIVEPSAWKFEYLLDTIRLVLDRIAVTGVAMELNTSGLNKRLPEMNPGRPILEEMVQRNIPVVLGADAHTPTRVAADYEAALDTLIDVGYTKISIFLNRERQELDIDTARRSLRTV